MCVYVCVQMFQHVIDVVGGTILSIRCTEPYVKSSAYYQFLGIPLWSSGQVPPTVVIQVICAFSFLLFINKN